jgi:hypothetical protein
MCELTMILTAASTAMSVMGSMQQGKAAEANAKYQAQVSANNATLAQQQAADATARGKVEEQSHRRRVAQTMGAQRANIAGSGFEIGDTTSQDILGDTASFGEIDAFAIRDNAAREAWGYEVQSSNYTNDAQLQRARGEQARSASYWSAAGDLLGGASKFSGQYSDWKKMK